MSDPYQRLQRSIDGVAAAVKALDKSRRNENARQPIDIDLLTSGEAAELKRLVSHDGDLAGYASARIDGEGDAARGMYTELSRLGLVTLGAGGLPIHLHPMAYWAVEKVGQRTNDAERSQRRQWKHDLRVAAFGGLLGVIGTLLGVILGWHLGNL